MVKSRDVSVSITRADISPDTQPHLHEGDHGTEQQLTSSPHDEVSLKDDLKNKDAGVGGGGGGSCVDGSDGDVSRAKRSISSVLSRDHRTQQYVTTIPQAEQEPDDGSEFLPPKVPNPFYFRINLTTVDRLKVALMTVLVFPIRVILVLFFLFLTWLGCFVGLLGYSEEELELKPIQGWRRKWWHPFFAAVMRQMFIWGGLVWEFKGRKASKEQAPLLVCGPHKSFMDGVIVLLSGGQSPCTKIESKRIPLLGTILRFIQPVFVKRSSRESRQTTLSEIKNRATSKEPWSQIVIFPEGTCSNGSVLLKFKQGAFSAGVPVQPVLIRYANRLNTLTWTWDGPSALKTMWLTTCQWKTRMIIEYLPVYRPSEAERRDPSLYAFNVRRLMAEALGIGTTEFGYDDLRFLDTGDPRQPHHSLAIVKLLKFRAKNGLKPEQLSADIEKVSSLIASLAASRRPPKAARAAVVELLGVASSEVAREMFDALEMNDDVCPVRPRRPTLDADRVVHSDLDSSGGSDDTSRRDDDLVDLRTLLAALHLANLDGESAFKCLCDDFLQCCNSSSGTSVTTTATNATSTRIAPPPTAAALGGSGTEACPGTLDDDDDETMTPAGIMSECRTANWVLTRPAFCRLCWLAMQLPTETSTKLFDKFRLSSPASSPASFRQFLLRYSDRCKGIVYFDGARHLNLDDGAREQQPQQQQQQRQHQQQQQLQQHQQQQHVVVGENDDNSMSDEMTPFGHQPCKQQEAVPAAGAATAAATLSTKPRSSNSLVAVNSKPCDGPDNSVVESAHPTNASTTTTTTTTTTTAKTKKTMNLFKMTVTNQNKSQKAE